MKNFDKAYREYEARLMAPFDKGGALYVNQEDDFEIDYNYEDKTELENNKWQDSE